MNKDQILGLIRQAVLAGAGALVTHGVANASQAQDIVGGVMALITVGWSLYDKMEAQTLAKAAAIQAKAAPAPITPPPVV